MKKNKLLLLGGLRYLLPVIKAAHNLGYYVITCDYIPNNIAHRYSDEYHNVSIIDKEAVLKLAKKLQIDGIMSFAVDPGVLTAAYVAEKMGLPFAGSYESVSILQNKDRFRAYLEVNGFNVPRSRGYDNYDDAIKGIGYFKFPIIVKPVDSAGSKGVTRVDKIGELFEAVNLALSNSISKKIIIEEFIEQQGCSSDTDCFSLDGELRFVSFSAQRFDNNAANPYTPSAYSWPSTMTEEQELYLTSELQRLFNLLKLKSSVFNIETRVGVDGKPYIMEVSPRGGGNRLSEMLKYATGMDLITNAVRVAVGEEAVDVEQKQYDGYWAEVILHAERDGVFQKIEIDDLIKDSVVEVDLWVKKGEKVSAFRGANDAIGTLVLRTDSKHEIDELLHKQYNWLKIDIR